MHWLRPFFFLAESSVHALKFAQQCSRSLRGTTVAANLVRSSFSVISSKKYGIKLTWQRRIPAGAGPLRHRRHRRHRGTRARPGSRHDGQLVHRRFAGAIVDPGVCERRSAHAASIEKSPAFWREHSERQSTSHFGIFRATGTRPELERALGIRFTWTASGIPVLADALVQLTCTVAGSHPSGDHTIFLGEVESAEVFEGEPLLFFRGTYRRIGPT